MVRQVAIHQRSLQKGFGDFEIMASRWRWTWTLNCFRTLASRWSRTWTLTTASRLVIKLLREGGSLIFEGWSPCYTSRCWPHIYCCCQLSIRFCALLSWVNMQQKEPPPPHLVSSHAGHLIRFIDLPHMKVDLAFCLYLGLLLAHSTTNFNPFNRINERLHSVS